MPMPSMRPRSLSSWMMDLYVARTGGSFSVPYSLMSSLALGQYCRASWNEVMTQSQPVVPSPPSAALNGMAVLMGSFTTSMAQMLGYRWQASCIHCSISARCCAVVRPEPVIQLGYCEPQMNVWNLNL